jgi:hypothetical protein
VRKVKYVSLPTSKRRLPKGLLGSGYPGEGLPFPSMGFRRGSCLATTSHRRIRLVLEDGPVIPSRTSTHVIFCELPVRRILAAKR